MMHWVWWLVGTVGFGGAIMIAVGFVFWWMWRRESGRA